jgi:L-ascorbate metabolism protein UlaG (beta-lactamase superfamily)
VGRIDAVILSHDHHFDNLDHAGRSVLPKAERVLTTVEGAARLGAGAVGLAPWQQTGLRSPDGDTFLVTATPARHGPPQADRGPVIGFILRFSSEPEQVVYFSGDTVWYDAIEEVGQRFRCGSRFSTLALHGSQRPGTGRSLSPRPKPFKSLAV